MEEHGADTMAADSRLTSGLYRYNAKRRHWRKTKLGI